MGEPTSTNGAEPSVPEELRPHYGRVLLKLGGEMFGGGSVGLDPDVVAQVARQIAEVVRSGVQVAVVIGGGNFFRGAQLQQRGMERTRSDYMGMLGTVMNCLVLQDFLEQAGVPVYAFPGLKAGGEGVSLRLFKTSEEATQATRTGLERLIELQLRYELAWL